MEALCDSAPTLEIMDAVLRCFLEYCADALGEKEAVKYLYDQDYVQGMADPNPWSATKHLPVRSRAAGLVLRLSRYKVRSQHWRVSTRRGKGCARAWQYG